MSMLPRFAARTITFLQKINNFSEAVLSGFWLGVLSDKSIEKFNDLHYDNGTSYTDDAYNLSGLQRWEYDKLKKFFPKAKTFMVIGAGGGRETAALRKWEREVDSYECSARLVEYANDFLKRNNIDAVVNNLPKNSVPPASKKYDGIIIGWGAYSHIQGRRERIKFLQSLKLFFHKDTRLLFSFLTKEGNSRKDLISSKVANFFRFFTRRDRTENGDRLLSYFAHFFDKAEIEYEIREAGLELVEYSDTEYGCVVASEKGEM